MSMVMKNPKYEWNIGQESEFFLLALKELLMSLENGHLGWFFDDRCNLLQKKNQQISKRDKMIEFIKDAIEKLQEKKYDVWITYFTTIK